MDETAIYLFLAALALIVVVIVLELYKVRVIQKEQQHDRSGLTASQQTATLCLSPDCIRCSRNRDILESALTKLSYISDNYRNELGACDVENITLDIKKSIGQLKSQEQHHTFLQKKNASSEAKSSSPIVLKLSGLREDEVWSSSDFPALQILDRHIKDIYLEFEHLYKSPLSETQCVWKINSTGKGKWEIAQLIDQGRRTKAADFCPITMDMLQKIPYFMEANMFGDVSFSIVHPSTEIETHCGSTNCRIRCHLGLKVPGSECFLQVGDKTCYWQEGKVTCFSDAFPHSVHHKGEETSDIRVVFMFDLWHPDITESQRKILNFAFGT